MANPVVAFTISGTLITRGEDPFNADGVLQPQRRKWAQIRKRKVRRAVSSIVCAHQGKGRRVYIDRQQAPIRGHGPRRIAVHGKDNVADIAVAVGVIRKSCRAARCVPNSVYVGNEAEPAGEVGYIGRDRGIRSSRASRSLCAGIAQQALRSLGSVGSGCAGRALCTGGALRASRSLRAGRASRSCRASQASCSGWASRA